MSKTTAPLLSFDARGSIGKTIVYSAWKGVSYARRHVVPANPNTTAQQETRGTFAWLNNVWRYMPSEVQESWDAYAAGQPLTGRNGLIKLNLSALRSQTDLANFIMAPSAKSGPVAAGLTLTPAAGQVTVDLAEPNLPAGWTIVHMVAAAILQQDPQTGAAFEMVADVDASAPYSLVLSGLAAGTYIVGAWFKYERPDGTFAYGIALQDDAIVT